MFDYNYNERLVETSSDQTQEKISVLQVKFGRGQGRVEVESKLNYYDVKMSPDLVNMLTLNQRPSPAK